MDAAYEGRKDINDMKRQLGLEVREIPPPPVFPPYEDTSEDEEEMEYPYDQEMLGERMNILRHEIGQSRSQRHTTTTHRAGRAIVSDSDDESGERTISSGKRQTDPTDDSGSDISSDWSRGE